MIFLLALLAFVAEALLLYLFVGSGWVLLCPIGIIVLPAVFVLRRRFEIITTLGVGAAVVTLGCVLSRDSSSYTSSLLLLCMLAQVAACGSVLGAQRRRAIEAPFYTAATAVFVLCTMIASFAAFSRQEALPPLTGMLMGVFLLLSSAMLTDVGLRAAKSLGGAEDVKIPAVSRVTVLFVVSLALAIASLVSTPLIYSAGIVKQGIENRIASIRAKDKPEPEEKKPEEKPKHRKKPRPKTDQTVEEDQIQYQEDEPGTPRFLVTIGRDDRSEAARNYQLYARADVRELFSNGWWQVSDRTLRTIEDDDDGSSDGMIDIDQGQTSSVHYTVFTIAASQNELPCLPGVTQIRASKIHVEGEGRYLAWVQGFVARYFYDAESRPILWQELAGRDVEVEPVPEVNSELPQAELLRRAQELVEDCGATSLSDQDKISTIMGYFHSNMVVRSEFVTISDDDADSVSGIIYRGTGNQSQLASAFIMCLRAAGVPARRAFGYVSDVSDLEKKKYIFLEESARVWAEVPVKGYGWVTVDPWCEELEVEPGSGPWPGEYYHFRDLAELPYNTRWNQWRRRLKRLRAISPYLLTGLALLAVIVAMIIVRRPKNESQRLRKRVDSPYEGAPAFCRMFYRHFEQRGCRKLPGMTPREYLGLLKTKGLVEDEHDDLIEYLYQISYGGTHRQFMLENRFKTRFWRSKA